MSNDVLRFFLTSKIMWTIIINKKNTKEVQYFKNNFIYNYILYRTKNSYKKNDKKDKKDIKLIEKI